MKESYQKLYLNKFMKIRYNLNIGQIKISLINNLKVIKKNILLRFQILKMYSYAG